MAGSNRTTGMHSSLFAPVPSEESEVRKAPVEDTMKEPATAAVPREEEKQEKRPAEETRQKRKEVKPAKSGNRGDVRVDVSLDAEQYKKLSSLAKEHNVKLMPVIRNILSAYFENSKTFFGSDKEMKEFIEPEKKEGILSIEEMGERQVGKKRDMQTMYIPEDIKDGITEITIRLGYQPKQRGRIYDAIFKRYLEIIEERKA